MSYHYSTQQPSLNDRPTKQQPLPDSLRSTSQDTYPQLHVQPPQAHQQFPALHQQQQQREQPQQQSFLSSFLPSTHQTFGQQQQQQQQPLSLNQHSPIFNQDINWNSNYRSNQPVSNLNLTPRMGNQADFIVNKSPYGSPTNQFKNPWFPNKSPNLNATQPLLHQTQTRNQFNNQLPTTYEYESLPPNGSRKNTLVLLPSRAPAPLPQGFFADPSVHLDTEPQRRQSVAPVMQSVNTQLPQQHPYFNLARRQSYYQHLKQLPAPQVRKITNKTDLRPVINKVPKYRRASMVTNYISPLLSLTTDLATTYSLCNPDFHYEISKNPKRVLTRPSEGVSNNGYDNVDHDYILYVNDVLGVQENRKYLVLDILGQGTFAQVVKCQNLHTKELVAVKVVKSRAVHSLSEISLLELINKKVDPNDEHHFLRLKDKFVHKNHFCLVFELLSSSLFELIKQNQYKGLSTKLVRNFTKQLLDSLIVLKDAKIIHCDLKPENILLITQDNPDIKVVDFGSACHERQTLYTYIQSRFYRSPEVILGLPYTTSIDTWSLGCIVAELFLGLPLFPGSSEYDQLIKITAVLGLPPSWMLEMGKNSKNFIDKDPITKEYSIKPREKYCTEKNVEEEPGKRYFSTDNLDELILKYSMNRKTMTTAMIEKEMNDREALVHMLRGLLNLNPLERWTPQQAILHPFITEIKFTSSWTPPGTDFNTSRVKTKDFEDLTDSVKGSKWF